jgi:creatinine amidohydrolase
MYRYEDLTWPEINDAVEAGKIPVLPVGSIEQHGPHLPLKVDWFCATAVCEEAVKQNQELLLLMPTVFYGYTRHVMDFPGTINIQYGHFTEYCLDITKSLAYHGFKKMIVVNGHGSNGPLVEMVGRRTNLETDAVCAVLDWWSLTSVDPKFNAKWRESVFPGGTGHACEIETSMLLHLDPERVRKGKAINEIVKFNAAKSKYQWVDLVAAGPVRMVEWTSSYTESGVSGEAKKGTAAKGKLILEEAARQLGAFAREFAGRPNYPRQDHHKRPPTFPLPQ